MNLFINSNLHNNLKKFCCDIFINKKSRFSKLVVKVFNLKMKV